MKNANLIPIHKSGDKKLPNNYCPVTITSVISKIMDGIIMDILVKKIQDNNIIHESQHGFCKGRSTSTNLIKFWDGVTSMADDGKNFSRIYTDFSKAFDKVPHTLLIMKLRRCGITGKLLKWLEGYLYGRTQQIIVGNEVSTTIDVTSGVPEGGVLSGLLFAIYINDLPEIFRFCKVALYADDAKLYAPDGDMTSIAKVQQDINRLVQWCNVLRLQLNTSKCFFLHHRQKRELFGVSPVYYMNGERP